MTAAASEAKHDQAISEAQCEADLACDLGPDAWAAEFRAQLTARNLVIVVTSERDALVDALKVAMSQIDPFDCPDKILDQIRTALALADATP